MGREFHAISTSKALSTTKAILDLGSGIDSDLIPDHAEFGLVTIEISAISSATQITWYIASDPSGDVPMTPSQTDAIVTGATTATLGGIARTLAGVVRRRKTGVEGHLYIVAQTNAGTCTGIGHLHGKGL